MIMKKTRNASFELLRIICMFMIVYYHLFVKIDYMSVIKSPVYSTILYPFLQKLSGSDSLWIKYALISIMIMMVCIALDKLFAPIYNAIAKNIYSFFEKYSFCEII